MQCKANTLKNKRCKLNASKSKFCSIHQKKRIMKGGSKEFNQNFSRHICKSCPKAAHKLKKTWQQGQKYEDILEHYKNKTNNHKNAIQQAYKRTNLTKIKEQLAYTKSNAKKIQDCNPKKSLVKCTNISRAAAEYSRLSRERAKKLQKES